MKKLIHRSVSVLLAAAMLLFGIGVYCVRYARSCRDWASFSGGAAVSRGGVSLSGTLTDRNGTVLASMDSGDSAYAEDRAVRVACLHAVGDFEGNIGTGALTAFAEALTGYDALTGLRSGGKTVKLSIDSALSVCAYEALAGRKGCVAVANYRTGEILCLVSSPAYDPEEGFDSADEFYDGVYLNRCISAAYVPGSVFKLVTAAAALENIPDIETRGFTCTGSRTVDGNEISCTGVHGTQTLAEALGKSCNCAFAELALELGAETLGEYAEQLGLSAAGELDGIYVNAGRYDADAETGSAELAWSGIGQSTDLVCPYSLLRLVMAAANGGSAVTPTLLAGGSSGETRLLEADTAQRLKALMRGNVENFYGDWRFPGLTLCAKSGTAETGSGTSHAWFAGFSADEQLPLAFVVLIEDGGGGLSNAGAAANTVLQAALAAQVNEDENA